MQMLIYQNVQQINIQKYPVIIKKMLLLNHFHKNLSFCLGFKKSIQLLYYQNFKLVTSYSSMKNINRSNQLDNLLYSTSQYDDDDADLLRKQLNSAQNRFMQNNLLNFAEDELDEEGVVLGNGQSIDAEDVNWGDDDRDSAQEWNHQQNVKYCFRQVAGNSENFSQSLSIHRADLIESKGLHDSINLEAINLPNILQAKKKEEEKVNEVITLQINELIQQIEKQQCLVKVYKNKITELQSVVQGLKKQIQELQDRNRQYIQNLQKKDELFTTLKDHYSKQNKTVEQKQRIEKQLRENAKSMQKEIQKLRNVIKTFTDNDRVLLDFSTVSSKQDYSKASNLNTMRELEVKQAELEKTKRENKSLMTELQIIKQQSLRLEEKIRNNEQEYRKKIGMKEKKIKQLSESIEELRQQALKMKKNHEAGIHTYKQKIIKLEKQSKSRDDKSKQYENKIKYSVEDIKKKEEKIKELLTQIGDKNKRMAQIKDQLKEQRAKNQIEARIQKQMETRIDKLQAQLKDLKNEKFALKREIENIQKPTQVQQKLKKQLNAIKKQNQVLSKNLNEANENLKAFQKQTEAKEEKLRQFKKKNDELTKRSALIKRKSQENEFTNQEVENYKETISKMNKQIIQLRKKSEANQQLANKLYILQSRIKSTERSSGRNGQQIQSQDYNEYDLEEINEALKQELHFKECQIEQLKALHQKQIIRLRNQTKSLSEQLERLENQNHFKQKSLDFLHSKYIQIQKQNTQLKASQNILHSSFYEETYDRQQSEAVHFYENKISALEKKIENLNIGIKEKDLQLKKIASDRQGLSFEIIQLKGRIKDLQSMAIANESVKRLTPESLSYEQTIDFLMKILKRIVKSSDMIRSLAKINDFRLIIGNIWKTLDKDSIKR